MEIILICIVAFLTAILTFFSGFGLGTILTPVFIFFFPVDIAIALTGLVHLLNNLFKISLVGKFASKVVLLRFGIPAVITAFLGAWSLIYLSSLSFEITYQFFQFTLNTSVVNIVIAILLIAFALIELLPILKKIQFNNLVLGGILSGFFGGLSGHQGALRSAFLIKLGLSKEAYIGTGVFIACFIDITRLSVYVSRMASSGLLDNIKLILLIR